MSRRRAEEDRLLSVRCLQVSGSRPSGVVEVQREDHGEPRGGVAVGGADAAEGPEDGEHGLDSLH